MVGDRLSGCSNISDVGEGATIRRSRSFIHYKRKLSGAKEPSEDGLFNGLSENPSGRGARGTNRRPRPRDRLIDFQRLSSYTG